MTVEVSRNAARTLLGRISSGALLIAGLFGLALSATPRVFQMTQQGSPEGQDVASADVPYAQPYYQTYYQTYYQDYYQAAYGGDGCGDGCDGCDGCDDGGPVQNSVPLVF